MKNTQPLKRRLISPILFVKKFFSFFSLSIYLFFFKINLKRIYIKIYNIKKYEKENLKIFLQISKDIKNQNQKNKKSCQLKLTLTKNRCSIFL